MCDYHIGTRPHRLFDRGVGAVERDDRGANFGIGIADQQADIVKIGGVFGVLADRTPVECATVAMSMAALMLLLFVARDQKLKRAGGVIMLLSYAVYFLWLMR